MNQFKNKFMTIPTPNYLRAHHPLSPHLAAFIRSTRESITSILNDDNEKILLIVGPCSIHDIKSTIDFATLLKELMPAISKTFFPIMRLYFEKPRSISGWKGFVSDPYLDCTNDISSGLKMTRQLLIQLADMGVPTAAEFLEPSSIEYFGDLISWGCIGARTVESQIHRQMASILPMPVGFKNSTNGDITTAISGMLSARMPHTFIGQNGDGIAAIQRSSGNPTSHLVLRGGSSGPNYDAESIASAATALTKVNLPARVIVDCAHDNSFRNHENQPTAFKSIVSQIACGQATGLKTIKGILLESHINCGKQAFPQNKHQLSYGMSITDPCLSWESTAALINWGCQHLATTPTTKATPCHAHL